MKRFKISFVLALWATFAFWAMSVTTYAYGAYQNIGYVTSAQQQHQNKFIAVTKQLSKATGTAAVWTVKAPYKVGKYFLTEMFRPFVPIRNKLIDMFGVEVEG